MFPQGLMVTQGQKEIELLRLGACPSLVAVAIGGGGGKALYGGGGSGYVNYIEIQPGGEAFVKMRAYAGSGGEDSYALLVGEEGDDSELVRGRAGMDSDDGGSENGGAGENCNEMSFIELTKTI